MTRDEWIDYFGQHLTADLGLTLLQAAGVIGNLDHESAGFTVLRETRTGPNEVNIGAAHWTGSRRDAFKRYAAAFNLPHDSPEASFGFLRHELQTTESRALKALRAAETVEAATQVFMELFERPGIAHLSSRVERARYALRRLTDHPRVTQETRMLPSSPSFPSGLRLVTALIQVVIAAIGTAVATGLISADASWLGWLLAAQSATGAGKDAAVARGASNGSAG